MILALCKRSMSLLSKNSRLRTVNTCFRNCMIATIQVVGNTTVFCTKCKLRSFVLDFTNNLHQLENNKKRDLLGITRKVSCFIVKVQSVSRVLSWTVIFLRQSLPKGSSEYVEMSSRHLVSFLAPSGVYMHALSPKRVWALTPHFHPYNLRCGIFLLHFP